LIFAAWARARACQLLVDLWASPNRGVKAFQRKAEREEETNVVSEKFGVVLGKFLYEFFHQMKKVL
jgi:hypothetical protein